MNTVVATEQKPGILKSFLKEAGKTLIVTLIASVVTAIIMLVPFYFNTNRTLPELQKNYENLNTEVQKIKDNSLGPVIDSKLNTQKIDDIQRQVNEVKVDLKDVKTDIRLMQQNLQSITDNQQKMYEAIMQRNAKNK